MTDQKIENQTPVSPLRYLAYEYQDITFDTLSEVLANDLTSVFWNELEDAIQHNNRIEISIHGQTTLGKSTLAMTLAFSKNGINRLIEKYKKNKKIDDYNCICSDWREANRKIMETKGERVIVVDDFSSLSKSGINATTEQNLFMTHSDMGAQLYQHFIKISPRETTEYDSTSTYILEIVGRDEEKKETQALIYYRLLGKKIPLGSIHVDVSEIIGSPLETKYRKRKFARLDLLHQHGVKGVEDLEISQLTILAYNELKELSRSKIPRELISLTISQLLQDHKLQFSIVGKAALLDPITALLSTECLIYKLESGLKREKNIERRIETEKILKLTKEKLNQMLTREKRNCEILERYYNIQ